MSAGLMCLTCRRYIWHDALRLPAAYRKYFCACETPRPSLDARTEASPERVENYWKQEAPMPDPTPLSPLAGIEQMLDAYRAAVFQNGKVYGLDSVSHYHEQDDADEEAPRKAILDYFAGLGKMLEEWREARAHLRRETPTPAMQRRQQCATEALYTYLTSPRETVGKEKE